MLTPAAVLLLALAAAPQSLPPEDPPSRMSSSAELPSLLSARALGDGGSALLFTTGVPYLSASYAQGISSGLDLGAQLELDWLTSELFAGGTLRNALWRDGALDLAFRARVGLAADFGATYSVAQNRSDAGLQVGPGLVGSASIASGVLSLGFDVPMTLTTKRDGGFVFAPRTALAFETPLFGEWSAGARVGGRWHGATGGAPLEGHSRGFIDFAALLTYRLF